MEMYEIYNELIKDLLQDSTTGTVYLNLLESADKGVHVDVSILSQNHKPGYILPLNQVR